MEALELFKELKGIDEYWPYLSYCNHKWHVEWIWYGDDPNFATGVKLYKSFNAASLEEVIKEAYEWYKGDE